MTKEKLFWPLVLVAVVAVGAVVYLSVGDESDEDLAARFIGSDKSGVAQPSATAPAAAPTANPAAQATQAAASPLRAYFAGSMIRFGYGGGTSSNNPRVELVIHYCASGTFFSTGQSCRPNIIAKGYQCTNIQDAGRWQVSGAPNQGMMQWMSNTNGPGSIAVHMRNDGVVVDPRGNPFNRVGRAQCQ